MIIFYFCALLSKMHMLERTQTAGVAFLVRSAAIHCLMLILQPFALSAGEGYDIDTKHGFAIAAASA